MLVLATATATEAGALRAALDDPTETEVDGVVGHRGRLGGAQVAVHDLGVGRAAVAFTLSRLLREPPAAVLLLSAGPALAGSGLGEGDLAVATAETYADLGVATDEGLRDAASLGLRLAPGAPGQTFLADPRLTDVLAEAPARPGPFLSADALAGSERLAAQRTERWGSALAETREGAAAAHACLLESVPYAHLRAIEGSLGAPTAPGGLPPGLITAVTHALGGIVDALEHPFS